MPQYAAYVSSRPEGERGTVVPYSFVRASITAREILRPADFQSDRPTNHEDSRAWATLAFTRGSRRRASAVDKSNLGSSTVDQATTEDDGWGGLEPVTVHLHPSVLRNQRRSLAVKISVSLSCLFFACFFLLSTSALLIYYIPCHATPSRD